MHKLEGPERCSHSGDAVVPQMKNVGCDLYTSCSDMEPGSNIHTHENRMAGCTEGHNSGAEPESGTVCKIVEVGLVEAGPDK